MSHITGAQIGDGNAIYLDGRTRIEWPHRVGALVRVADCYQPRAASNALRRSANDTSFGCGSKVLVGLGGAGKTQLASAFALESWASGALDLLIWITAASREAIVAAYAQAAADIVGSEDSDAERAANRLLSWLADTERRWLVVLDDLTNPSHLNRLWPPDSPAGQTIVTTRRHDAALTMTGRQIIGIGLFSADESRNYLTRKFAAYPHLADGVDQLADDLGHLPLALAQAAAYSIDRQLTCNEYCQRLADRKRRLSELLPELDALPDAHTHTVSATWSLSIDLADRLAPKGLARPLLELMCVLDPNGVPLAVLTSPAALEYLRNRQTPGAVEPVKPERARDALYCLQRLSLISVDPHDEARTVRVHGLVQRTTFEQLEDRDRTVRAAADALAQVWPQAERNPVLGQALCASAMILNTDQPESLRQPTVHPVLPLAMRSLIQVGLVGLAHALGIQLQGDTERYLGPMHPDTLTVRAKVANSLGETGDWAGAAAALEVLVGDCVAVLGADHVDTLKVRHNHAHWRGHSGDPVFAVGGLDALLADQTRLLGPDHIDTLNTCGNLAHWRGEIGDSEGARAAFEALLAQRTRILGPEHPRALVCRMSMAFWQGKAGDVPGALAGLESLYADQAGLLGPLHPDALTTRSNIAHWRGCAGDVSCAVTEFDALLTDRLHVLGEDNPRTLVTRANLAHWRGELAEPDTAVHELEALLPDQSRVLGADHVDTLGTRGSLAHWKGKAGSEEVAVFELKTLLEDQTRLFGLRHADTRTTVETLAYWQGDLSSDNAYWANGNIPCGRRRRVSE